MEDRNRRFLVEGKVQPFIGSQVNIQVKNEAELRAFYADRAPGRKLDWAGAAKPLFTVSRSDLVARCKPGDWVAYLIELRPCKDGPRAYGLNLWVVSDN